MNALWHPIGIKPLFGKNLCDGCGLLIYGGVGLSEFGKYIRYNQEIFFPIARLFQGGEVDG
jgi:hypothetical protein